MPALSFVRTALVAAMLATVAGVGIAQTTPSSGLVYTCVAPSGRTITADRLIAECMDREQRVLRRDGSLERIIAPPLTAEQRAAKEARDRKAEQDKRAHLEAVRGDRNLLQRFPDAASHDKARASALRAAQDAVANSEQRLAELSKEREPITRELEFYKGKPMPPKLRQQLNANDAAVDAQKAALANLRAEITRVNGVYDTELQRLKQLWAGAAPGSIGQMASANTGSTPAR